MEKRSAAKLRAGRPQPDLAAVTPDRPVGDAAARFRVTFEQAAIGLAHVGPDGQWLEVNQAFCTIVGYARADLIGRRFHDLTSPVDREAGQAGLTQLLRGEIPAYTIETRALRPDGALVWVRLTATLVRASTGAPQYIIACIEDITARKEAQQRLAEATTFLVEALDYETTLSRLVEAVVPHLADWCCVVIATPGGALRRLRVAHTDAAKQELLHTLDRRFPLDAAAPDGEPWVLRTGQPDLHAHISDALLRTTARDAEHLALLRQLGMVSSLIVPLVARDRTLGALTLVAANSGRHFGPADLVAAQDLASRAALAVDNARLYRQAQEAVRVRDDFLLAASHDLRTPLTSIGGYAHLIAMRLDSGKAVPAAWLRQQVQTLQEAAARMTAALNAVTDVAQLQIGHTLDLQLESIGVEALVRAVARYVAGVDGRRVTPVTITARTPGLEVRGDRVRLERVLSNVIGNAITYSPAGAAVQVVVEHEDSWAVIRVRDQGVGVPRAELPHLFTRFYRASTSKGIKGTGIGLAASKAIVEQHDGRIGIESTVGQGTTVTIRLPRADSAREGD